MDNEIKRKLVHIGNGFWAFLLPFIDRWIVIIVVLLAFIFVFVLSRPYSPFGSIFQKSFNAMARTDDIERGFLLGPSEYVFMVLFLVIFIDFRIAGAIFAILAFGDGFATVIGRKYGKNILVNSKTLEGTITFFIMSSIFGTLIFIAIDIFNSPAAGLMHPLLVTMSSDLITKKGLLLIIGVFLIVSLILSFVELYFSKFLNDNILIPLIGTFLLLFLFQAL